MLVNTLLKKGLCYMNYSVIIYHLPFKISILLEVSDKMWLILDRAHHTNLQYF